MVKSENRRIAGPDTLAGDNGTMSDRRLWWDLPLTRVVCAYLTPDGPTSRLVPCKRVIDPTCCRMSSGAGRALGCTSHVPPSDLDGLVRIIKRKRKKIQYRPRLIDGCLTATGLKIEPW